MRAIALMYHDVVDGDRRDASGFAGADAALYKLDGKAFARHLQAIAAAVTAQPTTVIESAKATLAAPHLFITFDDGGASAHTHIADRLEAHGWRGHFFVTTDFINTRGFLTEAQIRDLHARGHVIGTHSASHPLVMSACDWETLLREWTVSANRLADIIGEALRVASLPGGHYSKAAARAASRAGIRYLFTSEPTTKSVVIEECRVLGRYAIQQWTTASEAAALAGGHFFPRCKQALFWGAKKIIKRASGRYYIKAREALLRQAQSKAES